MDSLCLLALGRSAAKLGRADQYGISKHSAVLLEWEKLREQGYHVFRPGPLDGGLTMDTDLLFPLYGLSQVFVVADDQPAGTVVPNFTPPLRVRIEKRPQTHDGETAFTFILKFSERLKNQALGSKVVRITGGTHKGSLRLRGNEERWAFRVKPSGGGDVTVLLAKSETCEPDIACTEEGERPLSSGLIFTVTGPGDEAAVSGDSDAPVQPLRAWFGGAPKHHDGSTAFAFRVLFNYKLKNGKLGPKVVRVTGGTNTNSSRVGVNSEIWQITVTPSGNDDIKISLAASDACESGIACTEGDERPLSAGISHKVKGPPNVSVPDAQATVGLVTNDAPADDYSDDVDTTGSLTADESTTGNIETAGDEDWFAAPLKAKRIYQIDVEGPSTNGGTLQYPVLRGLHDADGNEIAGTSATGGGEGENVRLTYRARKEETHFLAVGADGDGIGTYTVGIIDVTDEDAGATPGEAFDLGDITSLATPQFPKHTINGTDDAVDTYRFTLVEARRVGLGLRQQDANADLFIEDGEGNVLGESRAGGTSNESVSLTLQAGTYYIRVEAQEEGANRYVLRYGVQRPDAD